MDSGFIDVMLRQVNISSLIFLKLFEKELCSKIFVKNQFIPYPIHYLCCKYGMINCFIDNDLTKLYIIFDNTKCADDKDLTNSQYFNIVDMFINSKFFHSITKLDKITIIGLNFDKMFLEDIRKIVLESNYSKVSDDFKNRMKPLNKNVPQICNSIVRFLIVKNIPYNIVTLNKKLIDSLSEHFKTPDKKINGELFIEFSPKKEFLSMQNIDAIENSGIFDC